MKKIYIKEDKIKLLKESNTPDGVKYNDKFLEYYDQDAYSFVVNKFIGKIIVTVAEDYGYPHYMIKNEMAAYRMGFDNYSDFLKYIKENDELYEEMYDELEQYVDEISETIIYEGRYWRDSGLIIFWDKTPSRNVLGEILKQLNNSLNISIDDTIVVIRDSFIPFRNYHFNDEINNEEFDGNSNVSDKDLRAIHLMNQQDKRKALTDFRQNRAEVQGKKLGKMPMAQYHSLIYQEEKDVFNWGSYFSNLKRIDESINKYLLTESQASKSFSAAKKLVMQQLGYDEEYSHMFIKAEIINKIPELKTKNGSKFVLGVTRMYLNNELEYEGVKSGLNSTIKMVASDAHINEYDRNLNGMSANDLINRFASAVSNNLNAEKEEINKMIFDTPSDYEIVRIDSFEQASEYSNYTQWCITHSNEMYDNITSNGINQFYFCLKNGFENIREIKGEGCPLDEYGLSMIAVSVNENGVLHTCTCRWNHDNGGNDAIMTAIEISQVIGMNFFNVFKPNNMWRDLVNDAISRLNAGESIEKIFDNVNYFSNGFSKIMLNYKYNIINTEGKILSPNYWFDSVGDFSNGFSKIMLNKKFNFINTNGEFLLPNKWFDYANNFSNGFGRVMLKGKYNFINTNGELLSPNQWFDDAEDFKRNNTNVMLDNKCYSIDINGILSNNIEIKYHSKFNNGLAVVNVLNKYNFINTEGELLFPDLWFNKVYGFENGYAIVQIKNKLYNFINTEGEFLSPNQWFDRCYYFNNGFGRVMLNNKHNFINTNGELLSPNQWFDNAKDFSNGYAIVKVFNKGYNIIDKNGNFLSLKYFDNIELYNKNLYKINFDGKYNFINIETKKIVNDEWFEKTSFNVVVLNNKDLSSSSESNFVIINNNGKYNYLDELTGRIMYPKQWFDECQPFIFNGLLMVKNNNLFNLIDISKWELISKNKWFTLKEAQEIQYKDF